MGSGLFRLKPVEDVTGHSELKRTMGRSALLFFSVGSIIGSGIFVILGVAIPKAGPAVLLSFLLAAFAALLSALSYAELASTIPASGSSYSYSYVTLGEIVAWVVGWMLMLEYGVSVAAVAVGWGEYLNSLLGSFGMTIPEALANPPGEGGIFNVPALIVVLS
ncbi:MAG TPA: amino acid permease, partial [Actinobacteria bacterium]|nr:amino acid permease [Actinomycetota bacterium]